MMPLLLEQDYLELQERGVAYVEDAAQRFLVLLGYALPHGVYHQQSCDVLIAIPNNYNHDGNDMFWTFPRLARADGREIPATNEPGSDSRTFDGKIFCRWSRHWHQGPSMWKAGRDNIVTILRRITWAFEHPDAK
jgi:hypothetical protein